MRVLVIEGRLAARRRPAGGLRGNGFAVEWLRDGEAGAAALAADPFDAVVLDSACREWTVAVCSSSAAPRAIALRCSCSRRATRSMTASAGLDAGADDYVVKPVAIAELAARLRALVRRASGIARGHLEVGALTLDPASRAVTWHGMAVDLAPREFDVLLALMLKAGRVVTRTSSSPRCTSGDRQRREQYDRGPRAPPAAQAGARGDPHGAGRRLHDTGDGGVAAGE